MNEGDRWEDYTIPVESRESRVYHMGHRLLKLPAENSWVACGRFGYWSRPLTLGSTPLCSVCRKAIGAAKAKASARCPYQVVRAWPDCYEDCSHADTINCPQAAKREVP